MSSDSAAPGVRFASSSALHGVHVRGPEGFTALARLVSSRGIDADNGAPVVPPLLADSDAGARPFSLAVAETPAPLDVLELTDIVKPQLVTREAPLELRLPGALRDDEEVLVVGFDGVHYLPVGHAVHRREQAATADDETVVRITYIPTAISTRSLVTAVRLLFRRLINRLRGRDPAVTRLAIATVDVHDGSAVIEYDEDLHLIHERVRTSERMLLVVHGIVGDTVGMLAGLGEDAAGGSTLDRYDLVLAFDYESINTSIAETARLLRDRLGAAGVGDRDPERAFDVVAHSMGGLVTRWILEVLREPLGIDRVVMSGTPNAGSPWATIENWASVVLAIGLNDPAAPWPLQLVGALVGLLEAVDEGFDELAPGSGILDDLARADDPHVPYVTVIGDRDLIELPDGGTPEALVEKLLDAGGDVLAAVAFLDAPNDLAVSEASALAIDADRDPAPRAITRVPVDHFSYLSTDAGRAAIAAALDGQR